MKYLKILIIGICLLLGNRIQAQEIFDHLTLEDGLPTAEVFFIYQDSKHNMWFCTGQGISRYDGYKFTNYTTVEGLSHNTVFKVFESPDEKLWFTCYDGSLTIFDLETNELYPFAENAALKKSLGNYNWVQCISFSAKTVNLYSYLEAKRYRYKGRELIQEESIPKTGVVQQDQTGIILNKTFNAKSYYKTIYIRDFKDTTQYSQFIQLMTTELDLRQTEAYIFDELAFMCTLNGMEVWKDNRCIDTLFKGSLITGIERDLEGNYWVGTTNDGVYLFRLDEHTTIDLKEYLKDGETINTMNAIGDHLVLGTNKGSFLNQNGKLLAKHEVRSLIHSITRYNDTLYSTYGHLFYLDGEALKYKRNPNLYNSYLSIPLKEGYFHTMAFRYVHIDGRGNKRIWPKKINYALKTHKDSIYYSTYDELFLISDGNFSTPKPLLEDLGLQHVEIRRISYSEPFLMLSTSGAGLIIIKNNQVVLKIDETNFISTNIVNDAYIDQKNHSIWCASNRGLSILKYDLSRDSLLVRSTYHYNRNTGLTTNNILHLSEMNGSLWAASSDKVIQVPLSHLPLIPQAPKVSINEVLANGEKVANNATLAFDRNNIEVHFNAFSVQPPLKGGQFKFRLSSEKNKNTDWVETNDRSVYFRNLQYGNYTFELSCRSENSEWSTPVVYQFSIKQFWLSKFSVQLSFIFTLILVAFLVGRWRIKQIRASNARALELKAMQLKVKQLELASLRGQINPHFIFNALKSIQHLILSDNKWDANELLTSFSKLIRHSLELSRTELASLKENKLFLQTYLDIESMRSPGKFTYSIDLPQELEENKIAPLMIQPICENAVKHAFVDKPGHISIRFRSEDKMICIEVIDNGIGYYNSNDKKVKIQNSVGLEIIKERIKLIKDQYANANFKIEALNKEDNSGTKITVCLPSH